MGHHPPSEIARPKLEIVRHVPGCALGLQQPALHVNFYFNCPTELDLGLLDSRLREFVSEDAPRHPEGPTICDVAHRVAFLYGAIQRKQNIPISSVHYIQLNEQIETENPTVLPPTTVCGSALLGR